MAEETSKGRRLEGRVVVVTGAAQGIGAVFALALARAGARVCAADVLPTTDVVEAIKRASGQAIGAQVDVTNPESLKRMVESTEAAFGPISVLVNNAALFGTLALKPFWQISSDEWDRVMAVNTRGPFECAKAVLPSMRRAASGKIINISSGTVYKGSPLLMHYVASKGAIIAMTRVMARELGPDNICVNAIAPGLTMSENAQSMYSPAAHDAVISSRALKRTQTPEDLTGALLFLASNESNFMTGQTVVVDGGSAMH